MLKKAGLATVIFSVVGLLVTGTVFGQTQEAGRADPQSRTAKSATGDAAVNEQTQTPAAEPSLYYEVVQVKGKVRVAPIGTDPLKDQGWTLVKLGDRLVEGVQISTGMRDAVKVTAVPSDPPTVMLIERLSLIAISELSHDGTVAKSRIGLGYGAIKAGVSEGETRSDMEIVSPVATLSKRGTDIFRFEYRNNRFRMELSAQGRGLVEAIQTRAGDFGGRDRIRSRLLTPGQWISHQMMRAIDEVRFDRTVDITDVFGLQDIEKLLAQSSGLQFLNLNGNNLAIALDPQRTGLQPLGSGSGGTFADLFTPAARPEENPNFGNFGIGQGGIPSIFGKTKGADAAMQKQRDFANRINTARAVRNMVRRNR